MTKQTKLTHQSIELEGLTLLDAINTLQNLVDNGTPVNSVICLAEEGYDVEVVTQRLETDKEYEDRLAGERKYQEIRKKHEFEQYLKLKAKFEAEFESLS